MFAAEAAEKKVSKDKKLLQGKTKPETRIVLTVLECFQAMLLSFPLLPLASSAVKGF